LKLLIAEKIAIAELRSNISLKCSGIAIAEGLIQVAELRLRTQKNVGRALLWK
jgi:hypothetical protein